MKISTQKRNKISEQILAYLYSINPKLVFTSNIASELARDEEFIKSLLNELLSKGLVTEVRKNPKGIQYKRRSRWKLSPKAYDIYSQNQL